MINQEVIYQETLSINKSLNFFEEDNGLFSTKICDVPARTNIVHDGYRV